MRSISSHSREALTTLPAPVPLICFTTSPFLLAKKPQETKTVNLRDPQQGKVHPLMPAHHQASTISLHQTVRVTFQPSSKNLATKGSKELRTNQLLISRDQILSRYKLQKVETDYQQLLVNLRNLLVIHGISKLRGNLPPTTHLVNSPSKQLKRSLMHSRSKLLRRHLNSMSTTRCQGEIKFNTLRWLAANHHHRASLKSSQGANLKTKKMMHQKSSRQSS